MLFNISKKKLVNIYLFNSQQKYSIRCLGLKNVVVVPDDSPITMDYRTDRVRVFVNKDGIVIRTPRTG